MEQKDLPTEHKEFGGFIVGESRNNSSTQLSYTNPNTNVTYENPKSDGWIVWDISDTGELILISAGNPETYASYYNETTSPNSGEESAEVLLKIEIVLCMKMNTQNQDMQNINRTRGSEMV